VNQVTGTSASTILGSLNANGRVVLINPNNITFGSGAQVNVGGIFASTLPMVNNDFANLHFSGQSSGSVTNAGTMNANTVALIAPYVVNTGGIFHQGTGGGVALGAGNDVLVSLDASGLIQMKVSPGSIGQLSGNGMIFDNGSHVVLASAQQTLVQGQTYNAGTVDIDSGGFVVLDGGFFVGSPQYVSVDAGNSITQTALAQSLSSAFLSATTQVYLNAPTIGSADNPIKTSSPWVFEFSNNGSYISNYYSGPTRFTSWPGHGSTYFTSYGDVNIDSIGALYGTVSLTSLSGSIGCSSICQIVGENVPLIDASQVMLSAGKSINNLWVYSPSVVASAGTNSSIVDDYNGNVVVSSTAKGDISFAALNGNLYTNVLEGHAITLTAPKGAISSLPGGHIAADAQLDPTDALVVYALMGLDLTTHATVISAQTDNNNMSINNTSPFLQFWGLANSASTITLMTSGQLNLETVNANTVNLISGASILPMIAYDYAASSINANNVNLKASGIIGSTAAPLMVDAYNSLTLWAGSTYQGNSISVIAVSSLLTPKAFTILNSPGAVDYNGSCVYDCH